MNKSATKRALPTQPNPSSREAILEAALRAFAQDGFGGASMPKIAKMAQVAPPLIHYYFGSKDNLWRETVDYSLGELRREASAIRSATRALAPLDRLRALLQAHAHFAARWPDHFVMIIAEARSQSERYAWVHENYTGVLFNEIVSILQDAKDQGQIKDVPVDQVAISLVGGILLYFTVYPEVTKEKDVGEVADDYTALIFRMLLEGVGSNQART